MTTIYKRLSLLGFAEWLEKNEYSVWQISEVISEMDKEPIDSLYRTSFNALAFRWLEETKGIEVIPPIRKEKDLGLFYGGQIKRFEDTFAQSCGSNFTTHPQAEIACLEKAAEIIESNK